MTWVRPLKRLLNIDVETCEQCQCPERIIACTEDPVLIRHILEQLRKREWVRH